MASMLRVLVRHSITSFHPNKVVVSLTNRSIFTHRVLKPYNYLEKRKEKETEYASSKNEIRDRMMENLSKPSESIKEDVEKMLFVAKSDQDIELLVKALKSDSMSLTVKSEYGKHLIDMLLVLNRPEMAYKLFIDKDMSGFLVNDSNLLSVMYLLVEGKQFSDAVSVFEFYVSHCQGKITNLNWLMFTYLTKSFYMINTQEALEKLKTLFTKLIKTRPSLEAEVRNQTLSCAYIVLLAINQNQADFAYEFLNAYFRNKTIAFHTNLKILALSKTDQPEKAVSLMDAVLNEPNSLNFEYKKFFPITIKYLKEAVDRSKSTALVDKLEVLVKRATEENQVNQIDLPELIKKANSVIITPQTTNPTEKLKKTPVKKPAEKKQPKQEAAEKPVPVQKEQTLTDFQLFSQMSELFGKRNFREVIELFERSVLNNAKSNPGQLKSVPDSCLSLVTCSLLYMNTKESLEKLKNLLEEFAKKGLKFADDSKIHLFLLALNQDDPYYALGFISSSGIEKTNLSLYKNLKTIAMCKLNNLGAAINELDEILQIKFNKFANQGAIYPYTINIVRDTAAKRKDDSRLSQRFEAIQKRVIMDNRISSVDLLELFTSTVDMSKTQLPAASSPTEAQEPEPKPKSRQRKTKSKSEPVSENQQENLKQVFYSKNYRDFILMFVKQLETDSSLLADHKMLGFLAKSIRESKTKVDEIKQILEPLKSKTEQCNLSCNFYVDIFLAIIEQKNPLYALEFIADFDRVESFRKQHTSIYNNILAIGFSLLDRLDVAFKQAEGVLNMNENPAKEDKFYGKIFPMTLKFLKESGLRQNKIEYAERYKKMHQLALDNRRISNLDLNSLPDI